MGHADKLEVEDDGYEGCSEGESDVDLTGHPQVQLQLLQFPLLWLHYTHCQAVKHIREKNSTRRTHGRQIEGSSELLTLTESMSSEVK